MFQAAYYKNPYARDFQARVLGSFPAEAIFSSAYLSPFQLRHPYQSLFAIVTNDTIFYPEGGGQPGDQGYFIYPTEHRLPVLDTQIVEDKIYHLTTKPLPAQTPVHMYINWPRRFDLMQQHSGEHLLSGIIKSKYGFDNVGFSLNDTEMRVDTSGVLSKTQLDEVARLANQAIWQNVPVKAQVFSQTDAMKQSYRSKKELPEDVRVVHIGDHDHCACCGVHVQFSGEIGALSIVRAEKHRGGMRLTVLCGKRAFRDYSVKHQDLVRLGQFYSKPANEVVPFVLQQAEEMEKQAYQYVALQKRYWDLVARFWQPAAVEEGRTQKIEGEVVDEYNKRYNLSETSCVLFLRGVEAEQARLAVNAHLEKGATSVYCFYTEEEAEEAVLLEHLSEVGQAENLNVYSLNGQNRASHLSYSYYLASTKRDMRALQQVLRTSFEAKGGGKPDFVQGQLQGLESLILQAITAWHEENLIC